MVVAGGAGFKGQANRERKRPEAFSAKPQAARNTLRDDVESEAASEASATFQPLERDLNEARQLLRLSRLEGRDPLQDAALGRLAVDRLDADADSDRNPQKAKWADQLRRELKERFNEIAPTSI